MARLNKFILINGITVTVAHEQKPLFQQVATVIKLLANELPKLKKNGRTEQVIFFGFFVSLNFYKKIVSSFFMLFQFIY
jgi:hypothetical protein